MENPTEELDIALMVRRSLTGIFALVTRSFFIQALNFVTFFALTIILSPATIGIYSLVTAVIAFLAYFSDIGLAAALIQKKEEVTKEDLSTTFYLQQALVITVSILSLIAAGWVKGFYHFDTDELWLYDILILSFFISSLKTIPSILLERVLRYDRLVLPQVVETILFDGVVLTLALMGFGVRSFIFAILLRDIGGLIAMYIVQPWRPRILFSPSAAKHLLSFGIPFQTNSFLALLKDNLLILALGKLMPLSAVGYFGFAQKWAFAPLRLVLDNVVRISFPSFSRMQHDIQVLGVALSRTIFLVASLVFPGLMALCFLFISLIYIIPKYNRWEPAIIALILFAFSAAIAAITTPVTNALSAIRKINLTLIFMVIWTVVTWVLVPYSAYLWGQTGAAAALLVVSATSFALLPIAKSKGIPFSMTVFVKPAIATAIATIIGIFIKSFLRYSYVELVVVTLTPGIIYLGILYMLARQEIMRDIQFIRAQLEHEQA